MSDQEEYTGPAFSIEYRLDATLTINGENWLKPGVSARLHYPEIPDELETPTRFLLDKVIDPMMMEITDTVQRHLSKMQGRA